MQQQANHYGIAIIGSGFGGLGTAIRLKQDGVEDFVVFERADDVGGTWRDNTYPGCACDVQSHLYSFSFALNPNWSRMYSPQPEIWAYLQKCARDYGILPKIKFRHEVHAVQWDQARQCWQIETSSGNYTAGMLVAGVGALCEPIMPKLRGLESFQGKIFHSARWDHSHDLNNRQVAVIGTGASAIQFVPAIQPTVGKLHLFQRTPPWIIPRRDRTLNDFERKLYQAFPLSQKFMRLIIYLLREWLVMLFRYPGFMRFYNQLALGHLKRQVPDPELRAKLTPDYAMGCKRILISNNYYPALKQPNVDVITERIREVRANSIVTDDGVERAVDTIILGTGFHVADLPFANIIRGRDGRTLTESWQGSPKAHLGTTVTGFPNFFLLLGPNTGLGHSSVVFMIESQINHIINAVRYMHRHKIATIEPLPEVQTAFVSEVDRKMRGTVWTAGGCKSWYLDANGRNSSLWPGFTFRFRQRVSSFKPMEYLVNGHQIR